MATNIEKIRTEGAKIAAAIGDGVVYKGPQMFGDIFIYHVFDDEKVTGSAFGGRTMLDSKANLMVQRAVFKAPIPNFPDIADPEAVVEKFHGVIDRLSKRVNQA